MSTSREIPNALKVFGYALLGGLGGGLMSFRVALNILPRFINPDPMVVGAVAMLLSAAVGMASAVTAGVVAGRATRS